MPLSRIRAFIGVDGGPTPRDAVLLKSLLIVHEGIAWAVDRPHYRNYREEIIPTALELYASLAQDVLEGVDLEVGHTLPESIFVVTGTARPSWPRWGGSPSAATATPRLIEGGAGRGSNDVDGPDTTRNNGSGGTGFGRSPREASGRGRGMTRAREFLPGPWVVFRVARGDYLEFYRDQAAVLDQAVGGSVAEMENMLM
ncbi:hypothetical protein Esi_0126_0067 [Ectocarpus siliculosus]|uniref:Uncharacterized protein n=1 Tax=Ectocarpus siliculosus TaxID=2880 RepID=D8LDV1_ECTSI|nr:hypothetical protein Esi_0126_0067 [Ectocarpus siliculosus]|eukprot:CBN78508.1 hypothetical protein Esi_0126_0067 [Ectocarpus siliculosus]